MDINRILTSFHDVIIFGHPNKKIPDVETLDGGHQKDTSFS